MVVGTRYIGQTLGRYRIESVIGSGGFATVYRAIDTGLERSVALKVVDPAAHHNPTVARRFVREGQAVASLDHPAVVPVFDTGETDGVLWLAMRLIEGGSLDDALRVGRRLTADQACAVVGRIGGALDHAHGHGIVHRDVKPSNILLEDNDPCRAWLVDFGIAVSARTVGQYTTGALGTAAYMAPEQSRPGGAGPAADIYSLGCVTYEMITGNRPFPGDDYVALLMAHANEPVTPVGHPRLDALFARALAKLPTARPATGAAFAHELHESLETGVGTTAMLPLDDLAAAATAAASAAPTIVEPRHDTLLHPEVHRPPPPAPVAPPAPVVHHRPPPPIDHRPPSPLYPPAATPPASQPAARNGRARILLGLAALLVTATATAVTLMITTRSSTLRVADAQGVVYRVPRDWERRSEQPVTEWVDAGGNLVATVENFTNPEDQDANVLLADTCSSMVERGIPSGDGRGEFPGTASSTTCSEPAEGDIAFGATANGQFWVITVHALNDDNRDDVTAFVASIEFTSPS